MVTSRLVLVYGPDRFARATFQPGRVSARVVSAFGALALPLVVVLFIGSDKPSPTGKAVAALLGLKVEALFAELKNQIGLRRLRLRRFRFVREQFFPAAVAQNIKRLVRFLSRPATPVLPATT
jgi:hypothetical protein